VLLQEKAHQQEGFNYQTEQTARTLKLCKSIHPFMDIDGGISHCSKETSKYCNMQDV